MSLLLSRTRNGIKNEQVYKSPKVDMGYDISDYEDIDPMYGTLADVDHLIKEMKSRGMKLMMDLVVNHTSDQVSHFLAPRFQQQSRPAATCDFQI